ncbi:porin family protein [Mucilaginibacter agri]|uniref:Outer membrane beta-barrel protein n=1 Tax=Mucilaginibacter agri TaxID=2695265 RepID=A0A965ZGZ4_9SPHI|nr:porin family protein [Mucilaginibacter agri]NCD69486.1 outer membrane beta-barrel protein [Mucilaginibacter agri]
MKKHLLSILFITAITFTSHAQFILGIKGGVNTSKLNTSNLKESPITGYQAGVFMRAGNGLFFQPEIYIGSGGGKFDFPEVGSSSPSVNSEQGSVRFTNLSIPLLVGKSFGPRNLNFRIMAGPVYTAVLDKDKNLSDNIDFIYQDFTKYKNNIFGYQGGIGIDVAAFTLDLRYEGGLTKVNNDYDQRQNMWALTVGFKVL